MAARCEYARFERDGIKCIKIGTLCGNQKFCRMYGRFELRPGAVDCPLRKEEQDDRVSDAIAIVSSEAGDERR